jgi:hypothetical protein
MRPNYEQEIIDGVARDGWCCVIVTDGNDASSFAYSVGFEATLGSPECIIFGLPPDLMHTVLGTVYDQIQDGARFTEGRRWQDLLQGFDCISRSVHPTQVTREHFNSARWHFGDARKRGRTLAAYQMFWPGALDGLFPWETGCSLMVRERQPALYLPKTGSA